VEPPTRQAGRVLELGCTVGGSAFALAAHFAEVVGVDRQVPIVARY